MAASSSLEKDGSFHFRKVHSSSSTSSHGLKPCNVLSKNIQWKLKQELDYLQHQYDFAYVTKEGTLKHTNSQNTENTRSPTKRTASFTTKNSSTPKRRRFSKGSSSLLLPTASSVEELRLKSRELGIKAIQDWASRPKRTA